MTQQYQHPNCNLFDIIEYNENSQPKILFIAGTPGNDPAGYHTLIDYDVSNVTQNIVVIPNVNPCGLEQNVRENPYTHKDMNRKYGKLDINNQQIEIIYKV